MPILVLTAAHLGRDDAKRRAGRRSFIYCASRRVSSMRAAGLPPCIRCLAVDLGATIDTVTTREKAHKLLDELPESEIEPVIEFIASRGGDPVLRLLDNAPEDDEPVTEQDEAALKEAYAELDTGAPTMSVDEFRSRYA
jgi:hypothetical protein